ncbi:hypothetical protein SPRG_16375 [Saprolegnia parasitica CBS 223.65]|uniref:Uncharacterized protein n=1 Tax=Saprolegnia parasitica (strain CBS 223.65) TaxID=695850 RepID=A0A067BV83_SAPPC|nr:hypothetical protein SPRG_16375 [Saprolegnia parasitica CBS 223.65]KDO18166.1 hypothetical protein SPRG_16375 [Saprolegnia parasitica CBS 223.65]|eukprot:XP_012211124.1 hypothetical protein SPRG_16375 [Saprolegnia parasitica CBS 223.65]
MAQRPRRFYFGLLALLCLIVAAYSVFTWEMVNLPWLHGAKGQDLAHLRRHNESSGHGIATATGADNVTRLPNATLKLHATGPVDVTREPSSSPVLHTTKGIDATTATPPYDLFGDVVHLNNLNEACFHANDSIVHWSYNSTEVDLAQLWTRDKTPQNELIEHLAQCPEVDVFLPAGLRDHGYCEDGMAYVKFLKTRALPLWVFDLRFNYQGKAEKT